MSGVFDYVTANWDSILLALAAFLVFAERIAQLTPTDADNKAVAWIGKILSALALKKTS